VKLSEAIALGAAVLKTNGPEHPHKDVLTAAQIGLLGRLPTQAEFNLFYWSNPWNLVHGTDLEHWARLTVTHRYRWADVINKLKSYGA
jgi:hypothetical protein